MSLKAIHQVFFSPSGTTKQVVNKIAHEFAPNSLEHNLLETKITQTINFNQDDIVIVGMPVFGGRIPKICLPQLENLHGNKTLAIACVVYGNREYDDALLELTDLLKNQGFIVMAAAAFIGQHSIFNQVAANRPDEEDFRKIKKFAKDCLAKIKTHTDNYGVKLKIKRNHPYTDYKKLPFVPIVDNKCNKCGKCAAICPVKTINVNKPNETDENKCITCTACIAICPPKARRFDSCAYHDRSKIFAQTNADRKEPACYFEF